MSDYKKFFEKHKAHLTSSEEEEDIDGDYLGAKTSRESSPAVDVKKKNSFHCRICNQPAKGKTEEKPEKEICSSCQTNFPNHAFCKSCRRVYPQRDTTFTRSSMRCNYCVDRLQRRREARNAKRKKIETPSADDNCDTYVAIFIEGKCVLKKTFKL